MVEDGAAEFFADADEMASDAEESGEPGGDVAAAVFGEQSLTPPNGYGAQGGGVRVEGRMTGNANTGGAVGGEGEMRRVEGGRDQRHAGERTLREVRAVFIDHQKTAITDEAEGIDVSGGDGATAEGFDGVEEEAGEVHRVRCDDEPVVFSQ